MGGVLKAWWLENILTFLPVFYHLLNTSLSANCNIGIILSQTSPYAWQNGTVPSINVFLLFISNFINLLSLQLWKMFDDDCSYGNNSLASYYWLCAHSCAMCSIVQFYQTCVEILYFILNLHGSFLMPHPLIKSTPCFTKYDLMAQKASVLCRQIESIVT